MRHRVLLVSLLFLFEGARALSQPVQTETQACEACGTCLCDSDGNVLQQDRERGGYAVYTYDAAGNRLTTELWNASGLLETRFVNTYDPRGNLLTHEADSDADGQPDELHVNIYDERGLKLSAERRNGQDQLLSRHTYTYDGRGNRLTSESNWNGDGVVDERGMYTYDEHGQVVTEEFIVNAHGLRNAGHHWFTYDGHGNRLSWVTDLDDDGSMDEQRQWSYDSDGDLLTAVVDLVGDARDYQTTNTYDERGNLLTVETTGQSAGSADYTYDESGAVLSVAQRNSLGELTEAHYLTYDESGNCLTVESDLDGDGGIDLRRVNTYDRDGNLLIWEDYDLFDGCVRHTTWTLDEQENVIDQVQEWTGADAPDCRPSHSF